MYALRSPTVATPIHPGATATPEEQRAAREAGTVNLQDRCFARYLEGCRVWGLSPLQLKF